MGTTETDGRKLKIHASLCDMRGATDEKLRRYGRIEVAAAAVVTTPTVQALLSRHAVDISAAGVLELPDGEDVRLELQNGAVHFGAASRPPARPSALVVNGLLAAEAGAEAALAGYRAILVNGALRCPESVAAAIRGQLTVNGAVQAYPDGAVLLSPTFIVDGTFALRARAALYYAAQRIVLLDPAADPAALREKGVRFETREALLARSLAAEAAPLLGDAARITVLPDGCAFLDGDATLDAALLHRHGGRLYVNGDLTAGPDAAALLPRVEYLRVNGDVWLPPALFEPFAAVDAAYGALRRLPGRRLRELPQAYVDAALLARSPDGVALEDCLTVELAADIPPETIERQLAFSGCGRVICTREQAAAVAMVSEAAGMIGPCDAAGEDGGMDGANTVNAVSYAF